MSQMASIRRVGEVARVEVQQAHPVDAIGHGAHQRHDGPGAELAGDVLAVRGEVLGDEHDLPGAELRRPRPRIDAIDRLRCGPRNDGMAQNPHVRSQPSAILTYAHGPRPAGGAG